MFNLLLNRKLQNSEKESFLVLERCRGRAWSSITGSFLLIISGARTKWLSERTSGLVRLLSEPLRGCDRSDCAWSPLLLSETFCSCFSDLLWCFVMFMVPNKWTTECKNSSQQGYQVFIYSAGCGISMFTWLASVRPSLTFMQGLILGKSEKNIPKKQD